MADSGPAAAARWVRAFVATHPEASRGEARRALRRSGLHPGERRFRRLWEWAAIDRVMGPEGAGAPHPFGDDPGLRSAFDDRFRGSTEVVRQRLEQYAAMLDLPGLTVLGPAIDLGCGRGEWLDVLASHGVPGYGVDADPAVVAGARARGLEVLAGDALEHLRGRPDGSVGLVTMFHFAEHLPVGTLRALLHEARRTLAPGGVTVVETPNPRNLTVGSASFYIDPTHVRPIPPELLEFLAEAAGFESVRVVPLNPPAVPGFTAPAALEGDAAMQHIVVELNRWLHGPMDSALVAIREPQGPP